MAYTLLNTDALTWLPTLPDNSVDLIITDPPYWIGYDGGQGWDSQWNTEEEYLNWCNTWTTQLARILKPDRMLIVWGTLKTDTFLRYKLNILNQQPALYPQNEIIWSYNWGGRTRKNFARKHEYAWCYSKGDRFLFNAEDIRIPRKTLTNIRTGKPYTNGTIPTSIWEHNNHTTSKDHINWHPTTKNLTVIERLIKAYSNPGDTILDCFAGSATTAVAAHNTGRHSIGTEQHTDYWERSIQRLTNAGAEPTQQLDSRQTHLLP